MSNITDFERQLMALDQDKLEAFLTTVISMYLDYEQLHPALDEAACASAISVTLADVMTVIDLDEGDE